MAIRQTKKPCHGCGSTFSHAADKLCGECQKALARARAIDERIAEHAAAVGVVEPALVPGVAYALDRTEFYTANAAPACRGRSHRGDAAEALGEAFVMLANAISKPHVGAPVSTWNSRGCASMKFSPGMHEWRTVRDFPPGVFDAFNWLDGCVRAGMQLAYEAGVEAGKGALTQLAAGKMTPEDFETYPERRR